MEHIINLGKAAIQSIKLPEFSGKELEVDMLRLDKVHPIVSGNKWFKLKYFLEDAREKKLKAIATFGGAWSNHIIATAYISKNCGFRSLGIIRGQKPLKLSQTLQDAESYGMTLEFVDRSLYYEKNDEEFKKNLSERFGELYFIPEGGAGANGIKGSEEILRLLEMNNYSHIVCCIGTGTMYFGLVNASLPDQEIIGISVLKGMKSTVRHSGNKVPTVDGKIITGYHFGGYAKKTFELTQFMNNFYLQTGIPTDFVYTGKLVFAFFDLVAKNYFPGGSKILLIHSGGLQGNASLPIGTLLF